jgi:hypothetical protein
MKIQLMNLSESFINPMKFIQEITSQLKLQDTLQRSSMQHFGLPEGHDYIAPSPIKFGGLKNSSI